MNNNTLRQDFKQGLRLSLILFVLSAPLYLMVECSPERAPVAAQVAPLVREMVAYQQIKQWLAGGAM